MGARTLCASLLLGLTLVGCTPKPKDFREAIDWGMDAQTKGDMTLALRHYTTAWELADSVGNGSRAVFAADLAADAALALGKADPALKLLDGALKGYPTEARLYIGRFRMPNNLAVLHAQKKNYADARRLLEETLTPWQTMPMSPAFPFETYAMLSRNLLIVLAAQGWSAEAESRYDSVKEKIQAAITTHPNSAQYRLGAGATLRALATLAETGPRAAEAPALASLAAEEQAREAAALQSYGRAKGACDEREVKGRMYRACLLELS